MDEPLMLPPYLVLFILLKLSKSSWSTTFLACSIYWSVRLHLNKNWSNSLPFENWFLRVKIPSLAAYLTSWAPSFSIPITAFTRRSDSQVFDFWSEFRNQITVAHLNFLFHIIDSSIKSLQKVENLAISAGMAHHDECFLSLFTYEMVCISSFFDQSCHYYVKIRIQVSCW